MSGGPWVAWIMLAAVPLLLLFARLHDPRGWRRAWLKAWANVRFGLRVCGCMIAAGAVMVAWSARPAVERLAVMVQRRTVRQAR